MDFGLWFEPEMVNPNSDLYRKNPEWALDGTLTHPILGRNQLVLNLSRSDVRDYLFQKIDALLSSYEIAYVKWDHNRPLIGGASHQQTLGFYALLDRLTAQHPNVQFESCASGGGRIDAGVAQRVNRFWASDSIDALDRLEIQNASALLCRWKCWEATLVHRPATPPVANTHCPSAQRLRSLGGLAWNGTC
jgi:alpha-galactosidase